MPLMDLLTVIKQNEGLICGLCGTLTGWLGQMAKSRLLSQHHNNKQLHLALMRERDLTDRVIALTDEIEGLWHRFYGREEILKIYHSAALTARREINILEAKHNYPLTEFRDLPVFPPPKEAMAHIKKQG
ncbi:hypothetical protein GT348_07325 [Aristophania vespae]|uniref:Uncharacterized protein n=1 Tax=Aristophania vespae TaxID=2697033 RepID=A0A6P1NFK7_9PROT|nr:hypothetical protein [Aristophania vespae]QHI96073.1 hypothetical protein GT348_07325 [Aristophania vespae]UMM63838.1 hypothetical protein DM15PD_08150 [Aristophania vespae]